MAGVAALRGAIKTALEGVSNIGDVYAYERFLTRTEDADTAFKNTIGSTEMIQFADVRLNALGYRLSSLSTGTTWRYDALATFRIRIFRTWNDGDASGLAFEVLIEDAVQAVVTTMAGLTPHRERIEAAITANEARAFSYPGQGAVVCHYGEVMVSCPDQVTV